MVAPDIVVTIGRQMGSGGHELGRRLASRLGIEFYDKELLMQAACDAGLCPNFFRDSDEKRPSFVGGFLAGFPGVGPMAYYDCGGIGGSDDTLYKAQCDFVHRVASRGSCVIVGRSADYILRDYPRVVSIFVSATKDDCIRRVRERRPELTDEQACAIVEKTDKARAAFYNFYSDKQWGEAASYDLAVSTSAMNIDDLVEVSIVYLQRRFGLQIK